MWTVIEGQHVRMEYAQRLFSIGMLYVIWVGLLEPVQSLNIAWRAGCLQSGSCWPQTECARPLSSLTSTVTEGVWPICLDDVPLQNCIVYSVGIADDWSFDELMGSLGCQVHSFDPTVSLNEALAPNVTFHKWGLSGDANVESRKVVQSRSGKTLGPLYTLDEIMKKLHHHHLSILKIDCEGCEWDVFSHLKRHPTLLPEQIAIEMHFSKWFGVHSFSHSEGIGDAFDVLADGEFQQFYHHSNGGPEYSEMSQDTLQAGFPASICCREMVFKRARRGHAAVQGTRA